MMPPPTSARQRVPTLDLRVRAIEPKLATETPSRHDERRSLLSPARPVWFVHRELDRWQDILNDDSPPPTSAMRDRFQQGIDCWIIQTWAVLRRQGWDVRLTDKPIAGHLCVFHADDFIRFHSSLLAPCFSLVVRPDRGPVILADARVVQNPELVKTRRDYVLPLWPEPGLVPRDPGRGTRLERLAYVGRPLWLAPSMHTPSFATRLKEVGIEFVQREDRWWDYSDVDAVLAVREAHPDLLATKPATKLTNAWLAGCIPVAGPEPAHQHLRRSPLDYVEVSRPGEVIAALLRLRNEPELFGAMLAQGRRRAERFEAPAIAERWVRLLSGPIAERFARWRQRPHALRRLRYRGLSTWARFTWDAFDLRVGQVSPRHLLTRSPHWSVRGLAACHLLRQEGAVALRRAAALWPTGRTERGASR